MFRTFNKYYDKVSHTYVGHIGSAVKHAPRWMILFAVLALLCGFLFTRMPGSFLPEEDQGYALAIVQLPPGASMKRTGEVFTQIRGMLDKQPEFEGMMQITGFSFVGSGENVGMAFIKLKPWARARHQRHRVHRQAQRHVLRDQGGQHLRGQPADGERAGPVRRLRHVPAGPQRRRPDRP